MNSNAPSQWQPFPSKLNSKLSYYFATHSEQRMVREGESGIYRVIYELIVHLSLECCPGSTHRGKGEAR